MILLMEISANSTDTDIHKKQLISADPIIGTPLLSMYFSYTLFHQQKE